MERKIMKSILIKVYRNFMGNKSEKMLKSLRLGGQEQEKKLLYIHQKVLILIKVDRGYCQLEIIQKLQKEYVY